MECEFFLIYEGKEFQKSVKIPILLISPDCKLISRIAKIRRERGVTQEQLAELVDIAPETISRLERGISLPSIKTLEKISQALHTSLKGLFDFECPGKPGGTAIEEESLKLLAFLKTKRVEDIKMCYRMLRVVFEQIEKNYLPKKT